jgi:hypothetical protein
MQLIQLIFSLSLFIIIFWFCDLSTRSNISLNKPIIKISNEEKIKKENMRILTEKIFKSNNQI